MAEATNLGSLTTEQSIQGPSTDVSVLNQSLRDTNNVATDAPAQHDREEVGNVCKQAADGNPIPSDTQPLPTPVAYGEEEEKQVQELPELPLPSDGLLVQNDGHTYPEGGLRAWLVVFGCWCGIFASLGIANSLGTYQAYISTNQLASYDPGIIGWIFSVYSFLTFACGVYIGPLFDVYGPRWLLLPGSACLISMQFVLGICDSKHSWFNLPCILPLLHALHAPVLYMKSLPKPRKLYHGDHLLTKLPEYYQFLLVFAVLGIGTSFLFTPCFASVGHYFYLRRGTATGIAASGGAMGGVVFPLMLQALIPRIGWIWSTRIIGFMFIFLCVVANLLVRARLPPTKSSPHPDLRILRNAAFAWTVLAVWLIEWGLFVPLTYITSYALHEGFARDFSYQILPILNVGSVFGRWLPGYYADKIGRYNTALLAVVFTIVIIFAIWLPFGGVKGA